MSSINLSTEALASASARRPWITVAIWAVVIAGAIVINSTLLGDALTTQFAFSNNPDSERADKLLEERLNRPHKVNEVVIVQSNELTVDDKLFRERVEEVYTRIMALGPDKIESGVHYYITGDDSMVSDDRRTTMLPLTMAGKLDHATKSVEDVFKIVEEAHERDGFRVLVIGESSIAFEGNELAVKDIEKGERIGVPAALIILLVLFGAVVAALMPILLAIVAIVVALAATAIVGQFVNLIFFVTLMVSMIGLAVGIDYSLIVISRFQPLLAQERRPAEPYYSAG